MLSNITGGLICSSRETPGFCLQQVSLKGRLLFFELHPSINCNRSDFSLKSQSASVCTSNDMKTPSSALTRTPHIRRINCRLFSFLPYYVEKMLSHIQWNITRPLLIDLCWSRANIDLSPRRHSQQRTMCSCARWQIHSRPPGLKRPPRSLSKSWLLLA